MRNNEAPPQFSASATVDVADSTGRDVTQLPVVCVQGLGFVGAAVCIALASVRNSSGEPVYHVFGVDLPTEQGLARIAALNRGEFPFPMVDMDLAAKAQQARATGNLVACADPWVFETASVIIVDVPLDVVFCSENEALNLDAFRSAVATVGQYMRSDALVIIETTVPPGATESIVAPTLKEELTLRGLADNRFRLAHCYERVMPGASYLDSIVHMPRVYAGLDEASADACEAFLRSIEDPESCPMTRLSSTGASELGKVLENTYRAVTIALMEEFAQCAEKLGIDLFEVVESIRARPTHSNMRTPGFGVGGYCLTKDPLLARLAAQQLFSLNLEFPFASLAIEVNRRTPKRVVERLRQMLGSSLEDKKILLLGVSYRQDVGDTRYSPSITFYQEARAEGADVYVHDPMVRYWPELNILIPEEIPAAADLDAVVLAVPHEEYRRFDYASWLAGSRPAILDAFNILTGDDRRALRALGCKVESVGRGEGL